MILRNSFSNNEEYYTELTSYAGDRTNVGDIAGQI